MYFRMFTACAVIFVLSVLMGCNNHQKSTPPPDSLNEKKSKLDTLPKDVQIVAYHTAIGDYNGDSIADTAFIRQSVNKYLEIKHGQTGEKLNFYNGQKLGADFDDFNWVEEFRTIPKGTVIFPNVIDGEIVDEHQVPANLKVHLKTDAIFLHVNEASGGGIIHLQKGKYVWVQQD